MNRLIAQQNLLAQLKQMAPLANQATEGPWYQTSGYASQIVQDAQGQEIADFDAAHAGSRQNACFLTAARELLSPENVGLFIEFLSAVPAAVSVTDTLTAQALHAAEQCMSDVLTYYQNGCSILVMDEAMKSLKNDGLKLVKAARKMKVHEPG